MTQYVHYVKCSLLTLNGSSGRVGLNYVKEHQELDTP